MADEKAKKSDSAPAPADVAPAASAPAKSGKGKLFGIVGAVMLLEGVGVFAAMKMLGGAPDPVSAVEPLKIDKPEPERIEEVEIASVRAPNVKDGKLVLWSLQVAMLVKVAGGHAHGGEGKGKSSHGDDHGKAEEKPDAAKDKDKAKPESPAVAVIKSHERTIKDRLTRIIRSAESAQLQEDGLETIKRQIKFELDRILGDEIKIVEILVPECTPFPTGF